MSKTFIAGIVLAKILMVAMVVFSTADAAFYSTVAVVAFVVLSQLVLRLSKPKTDLGKAQKRAKIEATKSLGVVFILICVVSVAIATLDSLVGIFWVMASAVWLVNYGLCLRAAARAMGEAAGLASAQSQQGASLT